MIKDIRILDGGRRSKARAGLARIQFAMSHDAGFGIDGVQDLEQFVQNDHLLGSTVVLVLLIEAARVTALIADADALRVEALDVASSDADGAGVVQGSIPPHIEVIAGVCTESACPMAGHQLLDGVVLIGARVAAMQHEQPNLPRRTTTVPLQQG